MNSRRYDFQFVVYQYYENFLIFKFFSCYYLSWGRLAFLINNWMIFWHWKSLEFRATYRIDLFCLFIMFCQNPNLWYLYIHKSCEKSWKNVQNRAKKSGKTWKNQGILSRKKSGHPGRVKSEINIIRSKMPDFWLFVPIRLWQKKHKFQFQLH